MFTDELSFVMASPEGIRLGLIDLLRLSFDSEAINTGMGAAYIA